MPSAAALLIPKLDLVAIRVADAGVRAARTEFAESKQLTTGALDFLDSFLDISLEWRTWWSYNDLASRGGLLTHGKRPPSISG